MIVDLQICLEDDNDDYPWLNLHYNNDDIGIINFTVSDINNNFLTKTYSINIDELKKAIDMIYISHMEKAK